MIRRRHDHDDVSEENAGQNAGRDAESTQDAVVSDGSALPAEARADVAGSGYPGSTPAEKQAAARDERRLATDGSAAVDRAVGRGDTETADDSGPRASDARGARPGGESDSAEADAADITDTADTETRELLTGEPPPNRRSAP
ncbi:hypothetical protein [Streptodolium elevatio]